MDLAETLLWNVLESGFSSTEVRLQLLQFSTTMSTTRMRHALTRAFVRMDRVCPRRQCVTLSRRVHLVPLCGVQMGRASRPIKYVPLWLVVRKDCSDVKMDFAANNASHSWDAL